MQLKYLGLKLRSVFRLVIICLFCLGLYFAGSYPLNSQNNSSIQTLIVATEPAFPPFEAKSEQGKLEGFDIDLTEAVAGLANFQVQWQSLPFDGIIPALQAGTINAAISAITITPERSQTITFSRPYFKAGLAIAIRSNNSQIVSLKELQGKQIAVQIGTTGAEFARKIPQSKIRTFDSAPLALQELLNGNVDAVVNDAPVTLYAIKRNQLQGIKIISQLVTEEFYGIALPKQSPYLKPINNAIAKLIDNGTYAQIYRKWFDSEPPTFPAALSFAPPEDTKPALIKSFEVVTSALPVLLWGTLVTLQLALLSSCLGAIIGSMIGIARLSRFALLRFVTRVYVDLWRGTPLLVQIFLIYFGLPALAQEMSWNFSLDRFAAAIIALSLNSAAYVAEIIRGSIQSIERGQTEAARSLGLSPLLTMVNVIFPQAFQRSVPALGNEFITLLKDTSLVSVIGFEELFRQGQLVVAQNYRSFEIFASVGLIYLVLTILSSQGFSWLERKTSKFKINR